MQLSSNIKGFITESIIYSIFNVINKFIPFLLLPFIIRNIPPEQFGQYSILLNIEALLIPIVSFNMYTSISVHYYNEDFVISKYLGTLLSGLFFSLLLFLFLLILIPRNFFSIIGLNKYLILIICFTSVASSFNTGIASIFRLLRKPASYGVFNIIQSIGLFTTIILVCFISPNFEAIAYGRLVFFFIFVIFLILFLKEKRLILFNFNYEIFKKIIKFSLPTVIYSLSAFVFLSSDRLLIKHFLSTESVGYYSAVFQIASVVSLLGVSINAAWMPWLFENLKKKDVNVNLFIVKVSKYLILLLIFVGLISSSFFNFFASKILPNQYHQYLNLGIPIIFGFVFEAIYLIVSPYVLYVETTKFNAYIGIFIAILNVSSNIYLIPKIGIFGAAYSFLFSWILLAISFFIFSYRVYPMPWFNFNKNL